MKIIPCINNSRNKRDWVGLKIQTSHVKNELYTKKKSDIGEWVGQKWPQNSNIICGWPPSI